MYFRKKIRKRNLKIAHIKGIILNNILSKNEIKTKKKKNGFYALNDTSNLSYIYYPTNIYMQNININNVKRIKTEDKNEIKFELFKKFENLKHKKYDNFENSSFGKLKLDKNNKE